MAFDDLVSGHLARMRHADAGIRASMASVHTIPDGRLTADMALAPGSEIGLYLHCLPHDLDEIAWLTEMVEQQRASLHLHTHDFFELVYVNSGTATHYDESGTTELATGDAVLLAPDVAHHVDAAPGSIVITLILRTPVLTDALRADLCDAPVFADYVDEYVRRGDQLTEYVSRPAATQDDPSHVKALFESIAVEVVEQKTGWDRVCESHLIAVLTLLARTPHRAAEPSKSDRNDELVHAVLDWVHEHYADVTLAQLSLQFSYSPSHISRLVRRHTGRKLIDIVRDRKLERAAALLSRSPFAIPDIARSVGFSSPSHLHKVFRARYGMSPAEYRVRAEHVTI